MSIKYDPVDKHRAGAVYSTLRPNYPEDESPKTMLLPIVKLKTPRNSRHPWIYKKMTQAPRGVDLAPGTLVRVADKSGGFVGVAFYHPENTVALRLLTEDKNAEVDAAFFRDRLAYAKTLRENILGLPGDNGDSYRLLNAEADLMPGLVIDKFAGVLLIQPFVSGWLHIMDWIVAALGELFPGCRAAVRADPKAAAKEGVSFAKAEKKFPAPDSVDIVENGLRYRVDFLTGHKTGFFLDQRENRARVASLAKGRAVLDLFSYTGGFALSAWKGGAKSVLAVDLDEKAIAAARINAELNNAADGIRFRHEDAFDTLRRVAVEKSRPDLVILDPPKLAGGQDDVEKALKTYRDLNRLGIAATAPGGLLVTCSCSGAVPEERWRRAVRQAADDAGRGMTILVNAGPGPDHPVAADFPQGQYLKVLFARVE